MPPRKPRAPPPKPDYSSLTIPQLQKEASKYGFKLSTERSVLLSQLDRCWLALHPALPDLPASQAGQPPAGDPKPARKAAGPKKPPRTEEDEEEDRRKVVELIRGDGELYMKVLRYEPINFETVVALVSEGGIKMARPKILDVLDAQSVTVYTSDPNDKTPRSRYR